MNSRLKYKLEITDIAEWQRTNELYHCTDVFCFFTLGEVWDHIGGKLKRERCGWSGIRGNEMYTLTRLY